MVKLGRLLLALPIAAVTLQVEGEGAAYQAYLAASVAGAVLASYYGYLLPGAVVIVSSVFLSLATGGVVDGPLTALAVAALMIAAAIQGARGQARPLLRSTYVAAATTALLAVGLAAPSMLRPAAAGLPGDAGLFVATVLSTSVGATASSIIVFVALTTVLVAAARHAAELAASKARPAAVSGRLREALLTEASAPWRPPAGYWLLGSLLGPLLAAAATGARPSPETALAAAAATAYFTWLASAVMEWRVRRMLALTWLVAVAILAASRATGSLQGVLLDAIGLGGGDYRDPLLWLAAPGVGNLVEERLSHAAQALGLLVRVFWGG